MVKFFKFDKNYKPTDLSISTKVLKYIMIKLIKIHDKEKNLRSGQRKKDVFHIEGLR